MARYTGPKHKLSRREGVDIFGTGNRSLDRRLSVPPGVHGHKRRRRLSEYAMQLREKQKAKRIFGVLERQFRRYYETGSERPGPTGENLLQYLERRLDNVVYRLGWAPSRPMARQLVNHGHVTVDNHKANIPSYQVKPGEVVKLGDKAQQIPATADLLRQRNYQTPSWLARDGSIGRVLSVPRREDMEQGIHEELIVEFYSR